MTALLLVLALGGAPPTYLVERVAASAEVSRRVSVFRDGTAVLAVRPAGGEPQLVRRRLDPVALRSLLQVIDETYQDLREFAGFEGGPGEARVELRLAPPGREPLEVDLPVAAVRSLAGSRVMAAIDDVDAWLSSYRPGQEDLGLWQPEAGERVELADGTVVEVLAVFNDGQVVQVRVGEGPAEMYYEVGELRARAFRLVRR